MIEIRKAVTEDIPRIMNFINTYWRENHILARDREFFEWMYVDGSEVNFIVAEDEAEKKIYGIDGFIKYNYSKNPDIAGNMWKVIKSGNPVLGLEIASTVKRYVEYRYSASPGLNKRACLIEKMNGAYVDKLKHYYILNTDLTDYKIAFIKEKKCLFSDGMSCLRKLSTSEELDFVLKDSILERKIPRKDKRYINHRYWMHPIYRYDIYAIDIPDRETRSVLIIRKEEWNGASVLKIIDFIGEDEDLEGIGNALYELIQKGKHEYIDFYCFGIKDDIMLKAGFTELDEKDENIIPNYFSPFEQVNVDIFFMTSELVNFHMYRGDGDQDRPN